MPLTLLLGGCASMFADKACTEGKWHEVGYKDGSEGRNAVEYWRANCGEHSPMRMARLPSPELLLAVLDCLAQQGSKAREAVASALERVRSHPMLSPELAEDYAQAAGRCAL